MNLIEQKDILRGREIDRQVSFLITIKKRTSVLKQIHKDDPSEDNQIALERLQNKATTIVFNLLMIVKDGYPDADVGIVSKQQEDNYEFNY